MLPITRIFTASYFPRSIFLSKACRGLSKVCYSETHEYARFDEEVSDVKTATIGISEYAQSQFGDVVYVEIIKPGSVVNAGDPIAIVESSKTTADVCSPFSGKVIESNEQIISSNPKLLNKDPLDRGWLVKIAANNYEKEKISLKSEEDYQQQTKDLTNTA